MASKKKSPLSDGAIESLVQQEITDAANYDTSLLAQRRQRALEYYQGYVRDIPNQQNRSKIVSRDLSDTVGWMMPDLMEIFTSSDDIVLFEPRRGEDVDMAKQQTDYMNYIFMNECSGYTLLWNAFWNALVTGNGPIKVWWDDTEEEDIFMNRGLTEEQFAEMVAPDDVEVLEATRYEEQIETPQGIMTVPLYDAKLKRITDGRLRMEAMPPEEFLISKNATDIPPARFTSHRKLLMRSDLLDMGFDPDIVARIPSDTALENDRTKQSRFEFQQQFTTTYSDTSAEQVELFESYMYADVDGDGHAEFIQVFTAGGMNGTLLSWDICETGHPFVSLEPNPMPHRWYGRGMYDETKDIQQINTTLLRQMLDNLYFQNNPQSIAAMQFVENPDELFNPNFGGVISISANSPYGMDTVRERNIPFVAGESMPMIGLMNEILEKRTGVSKSTQGVDADALQNQNREAVRHVQSGGTKKIALIARNFAKGGLTQLFEKALKLMVQNQNRERVIRLRDEWVTVDPRGWNSNMDVSVNIGLGTGSRDRDLEALTGVWTMQRQAIEMLGDDHPYTLRMIPKMRETLAKIIETSGLRDADQYLPQISDDDIKVLIAKSEEEKKAPSPEQILAQIEGKKLQIEEQKTMIAAQKAKIDAENDAAKIQADMVKNKQNTEADLVKSTQANDIKMTEIAAKTASEDADRKQKNDMAMAKMLMEENARKDKQRHDKLKLAIEAVSSKASVLINTSTEEATNPAYKTAVDDLGVEIEAIKGMVSEDLSDDDD